MAGWRAPADAPIGESADQLCLSVGVHDWRRQVIDRTSGEEAFLLAQRTVAGTPEMAGTFSDEDLRQLMRGFCQLLEEALTDSGSETREFFLGTAIPGLVAAGQEPLTLVRSTSTFVVLMTAAAIDGLEGADRQDAAEWLAGFFGEYVRDVAAVATEAQTGQR